MSIVPVTHLAKMVVNKGSHVSGLFLVFQIQRSDPIGCFLLQSQIGTKTFEQWLIKIDCYLVERTDSRLRQQFSFSAKAIQGLLRFNGYLTFIKPSFIQIEYPCKKIIYGIPFIQAEIMTLFREMNVFNLPNGIIKAIDTLQIGIFQTRHTTCPITTVRNYELRHRSKHSGHFGITSPTTSQLNGCSALTRTTTIKVRCQTDNRSSGRKTLIEDGEKNSLSSATRTSVHSDTGCIDILADRKQII